ncbi:MAG: glycosyltransferase [Sphingomonadales bacterium]|nr:MAG: glycosyltransferase [Sphingomonadales bacterium]
MDVLAIGHLPPPTHGQAVATAHMIRLLRGSRLEVQVCDIARPAKFGACRKILRHIAAAWAIVKTDAPHVYLTVNDHRGMVLTVALALLATRVGKRLTLHHHSSRYIDKRYRIADWLACVSGHDTLHLSQSPSLCQRYQSMYPAVRRTLPFSNVGAVEAMPARSERTGPLCFGHLGNLSEAKGIADVIATLRRAPGAHLLVAGPCVDSFAKHAVEAAVHEFGPRFRYIGAAYGADKQRFFNSIDVFLFPSRYAAETQGIVNLEALAAGVPVVAFDRGRIRRDIGSTGGLVVDLDGDFAAAAAGFDPKAADAYSRFCTLRAEHEGEQSAVIAAFGGTRPMIAVPLSRALTGPC